MKYLLISLFFATTLSYQPKNKVIYIQPLGQVDSVVLNNVKKSIENFYGFKCYIKTPVQLTEDLFATSRKRYEASKILKKYNSRENLLLVTEKDIAYHDKKRKVNEWGIIGLGYRPGTVCVVSTYRIKRNVSRERFEDRLKKVSIHEVGHNLGIDHCTKNKECIMNDANGTVSQIDREKMFICEHCKKSIR